MGLTNLTIGVITLIGLIAPNWMMSGSDLQPQAQLVPVAEKIERGSKRKSVRVGGLERTYDLYVPKKALKGSARLVIAFHGGGQDVRRFSDGVHLREMADRYGFVVALPHGVKNTWNAGGNPPKGYAERNQIDDLGFVKGIVDEMIGTGNFDTNHVYAMGVSKGGMMAYWAACNMPSRFAAIAVVAGTLSSRNCPKSDDTSLLHIHGTNDQNVPLEGGRGTYTGKGSDWPSAIDGIRQFMRAESCSPNEVDMRVASDTICSSVTCPKSNTVEYCLVQNGGHAWPGGKSSKRHKKRNIYVSQNFDATTYIADFFLAN